MYLFVSPSYVRQQNCSPTESFIVGSHLMNFERVSGKSIPLKIVNMQAIDVSDCYAKVHKANVSLSFKVTQTL